MGTGQIADYDIILPDDEIWTLISDLDGAEYRIRFFVPSAVALMVIQNTDKIKSLLYSNVIADKKEAHEAIYRIAAAMLKRVDRQLGKKWIESNFKVTKVIEFCAGIFKNVFSYFENMRVEDEKTGTAKPFNFGPVMALLMSTYGLTPEYILWRMSFPQVMRAHKEAVALISGKPADEEPERLLSEEEILAQFDKKEE